ncbi:MAG: NusA antitermination factor [Gammaproteobacteria bacterium]|jgi:N utilization substance protein A|nr:NusA antitermination factor [Gammaproteobacteria bacterium]
MSKEILLVADVLANEKGVSQEDIFEAIEAALATATEKKLGAEVEVRVTVDRTTGEYASVRVWTVVDDEALENPDAQLTLAEALLKKPDAAVGDVIEETIESISFGRIPAQLAKQVIAQKIRAAEKAKIAEFYSQKVGDLVNGVVKRVTREFVIVDLGGNADAFLSREEMLPREAMRMGDRVRAYLYEISEETRGPQVLLSRTRPEMLIKLFSIEVPEIGEELIEIKSAARDPGIRAKIAVKTNDGRIDPIGACVGMRGSRVQSVSGELGGERIDIVLWDDNPAQLAINALSPAEVVSIVADEETRTMDVAVKAEQLSQAIGRSGQNVRLASELIGWTINIMSEEDFELKRAQESETVANLFMEKLGLDEDVAAVLLEAGFTTLEEIAYVPEAELCAIEGFDEDVAKELQKRAKDILLTQAIAKEQERVEPAKDLLELEGMDPQLAYALASKGIITQEDLAEQAVDDVVELVRIDKERAGELIMAARAPWFADDEIEK